MRIAANKQKARLALAVVCMAFVSAPLTIYAQLSFSSAIAVALQNSPRIRAAESDVRRAQAALSVSKDIYIPSLTSAGGVGYSRGITLNVPTIFTANAQSLVYSAAQRSYIRGAHADVSAAVFALADAREQVEEDAAIAYLSLSHAQQTIAILTEEYGHSQELGTILQKRMIAGLVSELDVKRSQRATIQMKLDKQLEEDKYAALQEHLGILTGLSGTKLVALIDSIPQPASPDVLDAMPVDHQQESLAVLSAEANLTAKQQRAAGISRYLYRPQVTFSAEYGRVSPINGVSQYYNLNGHYNVAFAGVQIQFPFLDRVRTAASRESTADVSGTSNRLELLRDDEREAQFKLQRSKSELATRLELAEVDSGIAQEELKGVLIQLDSPTGGRPMTPEDEQIARIRERQKYLALLDTQFEAWTLEISTLRKSGNLGTWLQLISRATSTTGIPDAAAERKP